jgi:hypothetical protein
MRQGCVYVRACVRACVCLFICVCMCVCVHAAPPPRPPRPPQSSRSPGRLDGPTAAIMIRILQLNTIVCTTAGETLAGGALPVEHGRAPCSDWPKTGRRPISLFGVKRNPAPDSPKRRRVRAGFKLALLWDIQAHAYGCCRARGWFGGREPGA